MSGQRRNLLKTLIEMLHKLFQRKKDQNVLVQKVRNCCYLFTVFFQVIENYGQGMIYYFKKQTPFTWLNDIHIPVEFFKPDASFSLKKKTLKNFHLDRVPQSFLWHFPCDFSCDRMTYKEGLFSPYYNFLRYCCNYRRKLLTYMLYDDRVHRCYR